MKKYYLAVTPDRLELPIIVAETLKELSEHCGFSKETIMYGICRNRSGKRTKMKFVRVEAEEEE